MNDPLIEQTWWEWLDWMLANDPLTQFVFVLWLTLLFLVLGAAIYESRKGRNENNE